MSRSQAPEHNRMRLNNLLQVNGGVQRLNWTETKFGPEHCPVWRVGCLIDNILYGEGEGYNRSEAREAAAYRALTALMSYPLHR